MSLSARTSVPLSAPPFERAAAPGRPRHLLHVITTLDRGGAENHLADLVRLQRARGHRVTVAYLKGSGAWTGALVDAGAAVVPLGLTRYGDLRPALRLRRLLQRAAPTLVHAHLEPAELYTRLALLGHPPARMPLVVSKHNDTRFWDSAGRSLTPLARWVIRRAQRVIAISEAVKRHYVGTEVMLAPGSVDVVPYGLDPARYAPLPAPEVARLRHRLVGDAPGAVVVGTVARLARQKALHVQIEAVAALPRHVHLVVAGEGPLRSDLEALAAARGVTDRVHLLGFRADIPALMQSFDVFALSSIYEGFGLVQLEAMAARQPIVATRVSAIPEIVADGETGRLVPPGDVAAFAAALLEAYCHRAAWGAAGRQRLETSFTLARMADGVDAVYDRVLAPSDPL